MPLLMQGKATRCTADFIFGGVCLDQCFSPFLKIAGLTHLLSNDGCGATEVCTPCRVLKEVMPPGIPVPGCE
jgi:hypothetical protein